MLQLHMSTSKRMGAPQSYCGIQQEISHRLYEYLVSAGHSLGGAYATALSINLMSVQDPEGLDLRGLITFGAPLVLSGELPGALEIGGSGRQAGFRYSMDFHVLAFWFV